MVPRFRPHEARDSFFTISRHGTQRLYSAPWFRVCIVCLVLLGVCATTSWLTFTSNARAAHAASRQSARATLSATVGAALVQGPGFDTCDAPSTSSLSSWWGVSPYRWFGTYLGGEAVGSCPGTSLTASWMGSVISQGWGFLPIWSGLQSPCASASNIIHRMSSDASTSAGQGVSDADQAMAVAAGLGLSAGTPIFFDMEQYSGDSTCISATNAFLNGWDRELAAHSYLSGLYESSSDIPSVLGGGITGPQQVWMAGGGNVWSGSYNSSCSVFGNSYVPDSAWVNHQRAYQYTAGHNETYHGTTLSIDSDCGDFTLASGQGGGGTRGSSQTVSQPNGTVDVFFKGTNGALYHAWYNAGSSWTTAAPMAGTAPLASEPSAVTSSPGVVDVFWKGSDKNLWHVFYNPGHAWTSPAQGLGDGPLGGAPKAVAQSNGSICVFWRGTDNNLWDASYTSSGGWTGPNDLTSNQNMASDPAPVASKLGTWDIFWKGSDGNLWHVFQNAGSSWSAPQDLGDGPLGGAPQAIGQPDGSIQVVWRGTDNNLWHAWYTPSSGWAGPGALTSNQNVTGDPAPVNSKQGTWDIFWKGSDGNLWHVFQNAGTGWALANLGDGILGGMPVATGQPNGTIDVFWVGGDSAIWHAWYGAGGPWASARSLGGSVS